MNRIANYSTTVTAMKSVGEIQGILVSHGAKAIMINYTDNGEPESLSFIIPTQFGDMPFRLPANIQKVWNVLNKQRIRTNVPRDMAVRVSWRILKDWVRAQMAILETDMVTVEQVFLPYIETHGKTLYEVMVENRLSLPMAKKETNVE